MPVDNSSLSKAPEIAAAEPVRPGILRPHGRNPDDEEYEARLYLLRKVISRIYALHNNRDIGAYCVSLSASSTRACFLAYQVGAYARTCRTRISTQR